LVIALGNDSTTDEYMDLWREGFWGGALLGVTESLPAMIGAGKYKWVQRTAQMFGQVADHLNEEMMNDPDFENISEMERKAVSIPIGITVGILEMYGLRNVLNQKGLINKYLLKSLQKYKGAHQIQGLTLRQVIQNEVRSDIAKGLLVIGAAGTAEFETGVAQEIADISGKLIYNQLKQADLFQTPESLSDGVRQVLYAGAQEAVGGWVLGTIPATATMLSGKDYTALSNPMFETFEAINDDATYFKAYTQLIKNDINKGTLNKKEGQAKLDMVNTMRSLIPKVPQDLKTEDRKKAVALLYNKSLLEKKKENLAPELQGKVDIEIEKINTQLEDLIAGALEVKGTEGRVEEEEITDKQAKEFLTKENNDRKKLGLSPVEINPKTIQNAKVKLKEEQDASKKPSPVEEVSTEQSESTEEVVEGLPSKVRKSSDKGAPKDKSKVTEKKKTEIEEEVGDIEEFVGETAPETETEGEVVSELDTEGEVVPPPTENVTSDGKVKTTKGNYKIEPLNFKPLKKFATRVSKAISKILPKVNIILHETSQNFNKSTGKKGKGYYNPTEKTIHIDMTKASNKTIAHEMFHALLVNSVKTNPAARALTKRMVSAVAKAKGLTKEQKQKIEKFIKNYDSDIQNEEKLAEVLGVLAEGYTKLDAPTKSKVRQWINKIAEQLGINIGQFTKSDQDVIDLLNTVAQKLRTGEVITEKDVKALQPKKKTPKKQSAKTQLKEKKEPKKKEGDQLDVFEGREQKEHIDLAEKYMMNINSGFIRPESLFDTTRLKNELEKLGLRLGIAIDREGSGRITGYYFQKVSKRGKPYFYNPFGRQQKDINKAGIGISNVAELIVKLRENNFSPEAIQEYLLNTKKIAKNVVKALTDVSNFVLNRMPESFTKLKGGYLTGLKLFNKINTFKERLIKNNVTPYGRKITELQQELEALMTKKNSKRAIVKKTKQIEDLKERNKGAKIYNFSNTEIMTRTLEYMRKQPEYIAEKAKKGFSVMQAQMETQLERSFYQNPTKDMANQIRLARAIVNMNSKNIKNLDRLKSNLRNFIRVVLPQDMYSKPEIVALVREIQGATLDNIQEVKARIMDMATTKIVTGLDKKIKSLLKKNFTKIEGGRLKANIVDAVTIKLLNNIKQTFAVIENIKDNPKKIAALVQKNLDRITKLTTETIQNEKTFAEVAALEIINEYANAQLEEDSSFEKVASLNRVFTNLNETITEGRNTLEMQKQRRYRTYLKDLEIAWESITGNKIEMLVQNPDYDQQLPESKSNLKMILNPNSKELMKEFQKLTEAKKRAAKSAPIRFVNMIVDGFKKYQVYNLFDLNALVEYMTKIPGKVWKGPFQDITTRLVDRSSIVYKGFRMHDRVITENKLDEIYGKGFLGKLDNDALSRDTGIAYNQKKYNEAKTRYEKDSSDENKFKLKAAEIHLSPLQMAYHYNQYKDPANHPSYEAKYGPEYKRIMKEMQEYLEANNPETIVLANWMVEESYPMLYDRYNSTYKQIYGVDLPWNKHYAGYIARDGVEPQPMDMLADGNNAFRNTASPASSKVRIKNKNPIADNDLMRNYMSYQEQMNWFAAYGVNLSRIDKLFKNPNIVEVIQAEYPAGFYKMINHQIKVLSKQGVSQAQGMELINTFTSLFVVGRLGVNPTIYLKQLVSFPTYMDDIGIRNWTKHAIMSVGQINSTVKEIMNNSIYLKDRYGRGIIQSLENYVPTISYQPNFGRSKYSQLLDASMWLVKQGDKGAILIGGLPVYLYHKNKIAKENPGFTEQEIIDSAIEEFEVATRLTQQSTDLQNRDYTQSSGVFARTMNMFKTAIRSYLRKEIIYFRNMYKITKSFGKEGRGTFIRNLKGFMIYHATLPVLFQYLGAGLPGVLAPWDEDDTEDLARAAILGNLLALFVAGDILKGVLDGLQDKPWAGDMANIPLLEQAEGLTKFIKRFRQTKSQEKKEELLKNFLLNDVTGLGGLNIKSLRRWVNNMEEIIEGDKDPGEFILRLANFSEYQIKSDEERKRRKSKKVKLTKKELKKYFPEIYEQQESIKLPDDVEEQIDELKEQQKRMREEMLENIN
jgi:hypothetical protein